MCLSFKIMTLPVCRSFGCFSQRLLFFCHITIDITIIFQSENSMDSVVFLGFLSVILS